MTEKHKPFVLVFTGMASACLAEYRKVIEWCTGKGRYWVRGDLLLLCLLSYACPYTPASMKVSRPLSCVYISCTYPRNAVPWRNGWLSRTQLEAFLQNTGRPLRTFHNCAKIFFSSGSPGAIDCSRPFSASPAARELSNSWISVSSKFGNVSSGTLLTCGCSLYHLPVWVSTENTNCFRPKLLLAAINNCGIKFVCRILNTQYALSYTVLFPEFMDTKKRKFSLPSSILRKVRREQ